MAVEMIGGPRLCEPLLATGLGRFTGAASRHANGPRKRTSPHWRSGWVSGASQRATTNSLGTTSQPCASLPPWHSGFNQLSLDPSVSYRPSDFLYDSLDQTDGPAEWTATKRNECAGGCQQRQCGLRLMLNRPAKQPGCNAAA